MTINERRMLMAINTFIQNFVESPDKMPRYETMRKDADVINDLADAVMNEPSED